MRASARPSAFISSSYRICFAQQRRGVKAARLVVLQERVGMHPVPERHHLRGIASVSPGRLGKLEHHGLTEVKGRRASGKIPETTHQPAVFESLVSVVYRMARQGPASRLGGPEPAPGCGTSRSPNARRGHGPSSPERMLFARLSGRPPPLPASGPPSPRRSRQNPARPKAAPGLRGRRANRQW